MKQKTLIFYSQLLLAPIIMCAHIGLADAAVAQRATVKRAPAAAPATRPTVATKAAEPVVESEPEIESEPEVVIQDKSSQFSTTSSFTNESSSDSELAKKIRAQRAAADAAVADEINATTIKASTSGNAKNKCDTDLRKCMTDKCGNDFAKCAGDTDTAWGNKIESCRSKVECSAHEFTLFAVEIKADRDMAQKISGYNAIVKCGNDYNSCIATQCGPTFMKCIGKKYGDAAVAECNKIAKKCIEQDSGLAARSSAVFATLREISEIQVQKDEKRLYDLRDKMRTQCSLIGALFDDRSLDCVYSIDFFANNSDTPYASKKQYAGSTFDCNPDYFGIDVTTFKENAYRLTRSQTAASSAMLGAGVGTAAGAITSGAINRAIDRTKAEKDLKKTCLLSGGIVVNGECVTAADKVEEVETKLHNRTQKRLERTKETLGNVKEVTGEANEILTDVTDAAHKGMGVVKEGVEVVGQGAEVVEGLVESGANSAEKVITAGSELTKNLSNITSDVKEMQEGFKSDAAKTAIPLMTGFPM